MKNLKVFPLLQFSERYYVALALVPLSNVQENLPVKPTSFLKNYNFNFFTSYRSGCSIYSWMNFDDLSFKEFVHLSCQIYWHKVVHNTFFKKKICTYIFPFGLCWAFTAACGCSPVAESGGYSLLQCTGFRHRGFQ